MRKTWHADLYKGEALPKTQSIAVRQDYMATIGTSIISDQAIIHKISPTDFYGTICQSMCAPAWVRIAQIMKVLKDIDLS